MIALLSYSTNLLASNIADSRVECTGDSLTNPSTGRGTETDSVLIAYDDIRYINSKLVELEYEKQINEKLRSIAYNDSCIAANYKQVNLDMLKYNNRLKTQRTIGFSIAGISVASLLLAILLK